MGMISGEAAYLSGRVPDLLLPAEAHRSHVARRLKILRVALDKQPVELCEIIGLKPQTYSQWEGGTNLPDRDGMICYVAALPQVSIDYIYLGRTQGLDPELRGKVSAYERMANDALDRIDPKGGKRPKP